MGRSLLAALAVLSFLAALRKIQTAIAPIEHVQVRYRRRTVHHDDVFTRPQGREAGPLGSSGHGVDDVAPRAGTDSDGMQSELHAVMVSRTDEQDTEDQEWLGVYKICLNNHTVDTSALRESLSFAVCRAAD